MNYDISYRAERWNLFICKSGEYEMGNKGVWSQLLSWVAVTRQNMVDSDDFQCRGCVCVCAESMSQSGTGDFRSEALRCPKEHTVSLV